MDKAALKNLPSYSEFYDLLLASRKVVAVLAAGGNPGAQRLLNQIVDMTKRMEAL